MTSKALRLLTPEEAMANGKWTGPEQREPAPAAPVELRHVSPGLRWGAIVSMVALVLALVTDIAVGAYHAGRQDARLAAVERALLDLRTIPREMGALQAQVRQLELQLQAHREETTQ